MSQQKQGLALILEGILVLLAFVGIVIFLELAGTRWFIPVSAVWAVLAAADLFLVVRLVAGMRSERNRGPRHQAPH